MIVVVVILVVEVCVCVCVQYKPENTFFLILPVICPANLCGITNFVYINVLSLANNLKSKKDYLCVVEFF